MENLKAAQHYDDETMLAVRIFRQLPPEDRRILLAMSAAFERMEQGAQEGQE